MDEDRLVRPCVVPDGVFSPSRKANGSAHTAEFEITAFGSERDRRPTARGWAARRTPRASKTERPTEITQVECGGHLWPHEREVGIGIAVVGDETQFGLHVRNAPVDQIFGHDQAQKRATQTVTIEAGRIGPVERGIKVKPGDIRRGTRSLLLAAKRPRPLPSSRSNNVAWGRPGPSSGFRRRSGLGDP